MKSKPDVLALIAVVALFQVATNFGQTSRASTKPRSVTTSAIPQQTGIAVLSVESGLATQAGTANPLAGRAMLLLKESFESFLRRKGMFQGPPGSPNKASPLATWAYACRTGMPVCQQALYEARETFVSNAKMDASGKATFPGVPPGTYYLLLQAIANNQHLVWDLRVDLKPGANSVTLNQSNIAPLDAGSARQKPSAGGGQSVAESQPCQVTDTPRAAKPGVRANSTLSVIGSGYTYTYTKTDRRTGAVVDSFTERGNFSNTTLYLLDDDAENVWQRAGIGPGLLGSRFAMMAFIEAGTQVEDIPGLGSLLSLLGGQEQLAEMTNLAKADFACAMKAIRAHSVAEVTTDANARGTFPNVPAGSYYLYGRFYRLTKPLRAGGMFWNMRVEVKPGQNVVRLSVDNAAWKAGT